MCGCFLDSDCEGLGATLGPGLTAICEDRVCVEGCRTDESCVGWNVSCSAGVSSCSYCEAVQCADGCASNQNCPGFDAVCNSPLNDNCFYCDNNNCTSGCINDANCPFLYPVCGGAGEHTCGCSVTLDCPGHDAVCDIDHSNCHWCNGPDCRTGCHSDANCPMERPICGAGASDSSGSSLEGSGSDDGDIEGSGDESHRCGCSSDSDCFELEATLPDNLTAICEDNVCVEGCRADTACLGWNEQCLDTSVNMCAYCQGSQCAEGCAADINCPGHDELCSVPDHSNCFYCDSHNCTQGCASDANCPESYPLCGAVLPHRCGCSDNSDCKVGYTCNNADSRCTAPVGKVLLESIKVYTSDCTGCTTEGVVVRLLGERNFDYMSGTPCTTNILDLPGSQEYGSSTSSEFEDRDQLGACYQAALNARLTDGGTLTWSGSGDWTPGSISPSHDPMICVDWMDPSAFSWTCKLVGPASGGAGTVWTLDDCDINPFFSVSCP